MKPRMPVNSAVPIPTPASRRSEARSPPGMATIPGSIERALLIAAPCSAGISASPVAARERAQNATTSKGKSGLHRRSSVRHSSADAVFFLLPASLLPSASLRITVLPRRTRVPVGCQLARRTATGLMGWRGHTAGGECRPVACATSRQANSVRIMRCDDAADGWLRSALRVVEYSPGKSSPRDSSRGGALMYKIQ